MPDDFLHDLRKKLNGFSRHDKDDLIEEVGSHMESGVEDPKLGKDSGQRRERLMSELGSSEQMAKGFRKVYQPGSLFDYLLIAIPYLLNLPINLLLVTLMPKYPWADARLVIIFHLILIAIGLWRKTILLTVYWLADLSIQLIGVLLVAKGYYGSLQTALWSVVIAGLIIQLGRMVWQNRRDLLIITFALLPFFMGLLVIVFSITTHTNTYSYEELEIFFFRIYLNYANYIYFAIPIVLAPFILVRDRNVRWMALAIFCLLLGLSRDRLDYQVIYPPFVYYLWIFLPLAVIILGWSLDHFRHNTLKFAT
jgi:hypothetical protein